MARLRRNSVIEPKVSVRCCARAAQQAVLPVIGFFHSGSPSGRSPRLAAFHAGLGEAGYAAIREGLNGPDCEPSARARPKRWNRHSIYRFHKQVIWSSERGTTTYIRCPIATASR
jgi:hypothetical protein